MPLFTYIAVFFAIFQGEGGGAATLALTVSKCENFDPFFVQNTLYLIVRGLKNAFVMSLMIECYPAILLFDHFVTEQQQAVRSTYDRSTLPPRPTLLSDRKVGVGGGQRLRSA